MELNCLGETCPIPVIKTKKALAEAGENSSVKVLVDNLEAMENIEKMVKNAGYPYTAIENNGIFEIEIKKGTGEKQEKKSAKPEKNNDNVVVVISSDEMGTGNPELGKTLLKTYLYTLTETDLLPKTIIFYNSGVKMTTEGSSSIKDIETLKEMGVDILNCGACLNFYGLTELLKVGRVSNMYEIASLMLGASSVVYP